MSIDSSKDKQELNDEVNVSKIFNQNHIPTSRMLTNIIKRCSDSNDHFSALHHANQLYNNHDIDLCRIKKKSQLIDSSKDTKILVELCRCLFNCQKYRMIIEIIDDPKDDIELTLLYCQALIKIEEHSKAIGFIDKLLNNDVTDDDDMMKKVSKRSLRFKIFYLRGQCYEEINILKLSAESYLEAFLLQPISFHCLDKVNELSAFVSTTKQDIISKVATDPTLNNKLKQYTIGYINNKFAEDLHLPHCFSSSIDLIDPSTNLALNLLIRHYFDDAKTILWKLFMLNNNDSINIKLLIESIVYTQSKLDIMNLIVKLADSSPCHYLTWYAVGSYNYLINNFKSAETELSYCIKLNKSFSHGYLALGLIDAHLSDFTMSTYHFIYATSVSKRSEPWILAALNSAKHSDYQKTLSFLMNALEIDSSNFTVLIICSSIFLTRSNYNAAKYFLSRAIKVFETLHGSKYSIYYENALFNLAMCDIFLRNFEEAIDILQNKIISYRNNETYNIAMAIALYMTNGSKIQKLDQYVSRISKVEIASLFLPINAASKDQNST